MGWGCDGVGCVMEVGQGCHVHSGDDDPFSPPQNWNQAMLGSKHVASGWRGRKLFTSMASSASSSYRYRVVCTLSFHCHSLTKE